jgi:hypothetical protein
MLPKMVDDASRDEDVCKRRRAKPDENSILDLVKLAKVAIVVAETGANDGKGGGDRCEEEDEGGKELLPASEDVDLASKVDLSDSREDASEGCSDAERPGWNNEVGVVAEV